MAIASALRRAPRAAALLAALGSRAGGRVLPLHHRAAHVSPFSSLPAPQPSAADAQLLRVINFEISSAQSECRKPNWAKILGEDFPFEIKDKEGTNRITLTRTCKSEQIEVEVLLPSPVEEDQAEDGEKQSQSHASSDVVSSQYYCIPLVVRIHKGAAASCLEISCRSYPTELVIESLEFRSSGASGGSLSGGTAFSNLPEEIQKALHPYLGIRGISQHFTDFLHAYMINKECHEYLSWLRKLKGLIKR
ncbi:uncharacterized protein At2g39795, mitochondrial-like [Lolium rigidum]|uniref:uncharacterized protein At2g39795, mitochondrial-like n=1 Tax=Lolium rigidum TaxID=89674 RepID=UPI001F5D1BF6|nr:uncharacterized protein At2g39795, mitochondrial-like [Lolium rigidum]